LKKGGPYENANKTIPLKCLKVLKEINLKNK